MSPVLLVSGGKWRWRKCHWKCHPPCHTSNAVASVCSDSPFHSVRCTPPPINAGSVHCQIPRLFLFMSTVNTPDLSNGCKKLPPAFIRQIYYPETHLSLAQAEDSRVMTALSTGRWKKNLQVVLNAKCWLMRMCVWMCDNPGEVFTSSQGSYRYKW